MERTTRSTGTTRSEAAQPHRRPRLQRLRGDMVSHHALRAAALRGLPGLTVLMTQDFGAQPGDLNPLGYMRV
jgi:hypothetical protein